MMKDSTSYATLSPKALELLKKRARRLSLLKESQTSHSTSVEKESYLCFRLFSDHYGFPLPSVCEVIKPRNILSIPRTPSHVVGFARHREKVLALVDLRRFWFTAPIGHTDNDFAVVIDEKGASCGVICTDIEEILKIDQQDIQAVPQNLPQLLAHSLRGIWQQNILLISPSALFGLEGFIVGTTEGHF